eukprot:5345276-Prymnesium_polylepis.2
MSQGLYKFCRVPANASNHDVVDGSSPSNRADGSSCALTALAHAAAAQAMTAAPRSLAAPPAARPASAGRAPVSPGWTGAG